MRDTSPPRCDNEQPLQYHDRRADAHFECQFSKHTKPSQCIHMQAVAKGKKKIKATGGPKKPAFVLPNEAQKHVSQTLSNLTSAGHIPKGWSTKSLHHCFEHPGFLKAHDWLLLAGPVGKYALQVQSCYEKLAALAPCAPLSVLQRTATSVMVQAVDAESLRGDVLLAGLPASSSGSCPIWVL